MSSFLPKVTVIHLKKKKKNSKALPLLITKLHSFETLSNVHTQSRYSNEMNANSTISMLSSLTITIDTYVGLFIYVTGVLGSIGNIIVYRSKSMRNRACSIYLLWESIIDFLYLNIVVLTGILTKDFRIPVATRHEILCKFRSFFSTYGNQLAVTFLSLATIDRILLSQRSQSKF